MHYIAERLGTFLADLAYHELPDRVVHKARFCLLDAVGCLAGARQTDLGPIIARYSDCLENGWSDHQCRSSHRIDPATRAGIYALLINALDYDDIYWKGHPGATVNGAVLSLAHSMTLSGTEVILGIVAGYEISCRIAMSLEHSTPRKTVHGHGTWQIFGAAAATAKLLGLDASQSAHALAIAAANAPVPSVMKTVYGDQPTPTKNNFFSAAHAGVTAACFAKAGMTGPLDIFEGETGFWKMAGADGNDPERLCFRLGQHFEIDDVGFKAFSCCRIIQACAQAIETAIKDVRPLSLTNGIDLIVAAVPEIACAPPFSVRRPTTMTAAQFSVSHAIIATIEGLSSGPQWFGPDTLERLAQHPLNDKILLRPRRPAAWHGADVSLTFSDGRSSSCNVHIADGDAASPLSDVFLCRKFMRLASPALGRDAAARALDAITSLQSAGSMDKLVIALEGTGHESGVLPLPSANG